MKTIIARIKTTLPEAAQECLDLIGEGANPQATQAETFFSRCNTPPQVGFIRIPVDDHIVPLLEMFKNSGYISKHVEIVRIEHHGQDIVEVIDDEGTRYEEQPFQVGVTENEDGTFTPQYLGRIGQ